MSALLPTKEVLRAVEQRFRAWSSGDAVAALEACTDDIAYWDTKTASGIAGKAALGRHLGEFFGRYHASFRIVEEHRLEGRDGAIVLWECAVRERGPAGRPGEQVVMQRGMGLFFVRDNVICRDEAYCDLGALDAQFAAARQTAADHRPGASPGAPAC